MRLTRLFNFGSDIDRIALLNRLQGPEARPYVSLFTVPYEYHLFFDDCLVRRPITRDGYESSALNGFHQFLFLNLSDYVDKLYSFCLADTCC